jgi:GDP-mannose 6-dehydrogenase
MRISVFGLGYVGCVTAACLADRGHNVIGVELDEEKARLLNEGQSPIVEPGLPQLIARVVRSGNLHATLWAREAVANTELAFICVGTPGHASGQLNLDAIIRVCRDIGREMARSRAAYTVVVRSTLLPGTTDGVIRPALLGGTSDALRTTPRIAVNPEFMREGTALKDFAQPPLTLVGCGDPEAAQMLREIYADIEAPFVHTEVRTAEMVKYASNAFHALKVCFANEMGDVCDAFGADAQEVMRIFRMDRKLNVSDAYLRPGFAFGGSCLPKDLRAVLHAAGRADVSTPLLDAILPSNELQVQRGVQAVMRARKRRVGVIGLSFKAGTDDLRESPMVTLVETLIGKGFDVRIIDRNVSLARLVGANRRYIEEQIPHISSLLVGDVDELLAHAEVLVIGAEGADADAARAHANRESTIIDLARRSLRYGQKARMEA